MAAKPYLLVASAVSSISGVIAGGAFALYGATRPNPGRRAERAEAALREGRYQEAIELFVSLGAYAKAARASLKSGKIEDAAAYSIQAGDWGTAAQANAQLKKPEEAAKYFDLAGKTAEAADQWEKAKHFENALARYRTSRNIRKTEELLIKLGRPVEIGDLYVDEYRRYQSRLGPHPSPQEHETSKAYLVRAGQAFRQAKDLKKASAVFIRGGLLKEAAGCQEELGDHRKAADLYLQAGRNDDAARLFVVVGQYERAIDLLEEMGKAEEIPKLLELAGRKDEAKAFAGRLALAKNDVEEAARLFGEAGEAKQAAELFQELGQMGKAAQYWEAAENFPEAAKAYRAAGAVAKAAPLFARIGNHIEAAECFEAAGIPAQAMKEYQEAGKFMSAARMAEHHSSVDEAIALYQRVHPGTPDFLAATHGLARLFWRKGMHKLAEEKFRILCGKGEITAGSIEAYYEFATYLEGTGKFSEACEILDRVLVVDFHYKDVLSRKQALEIRMKSEPKVPPQIKLVSGEGQTFAPGPGKILAERYEIDRQIGAGGMGVVYHALDRKLGREVALKFLPPHLTASKEEQSRILREAKMAAQLSHPNIIGLYDMSVHRNNFFLVMEFVNGPNLKQILDESGPLPVESVREIGIQVASALAFAHGRQVVHRDIKSANLMMSPERLVKVGDFGLARVMEGGKAGATQALGTPTYMAPEQIHGAAFDQRVDLYSLGVVLYELLVGVPPFVSGEVAYHHIHTAPKPLRETRPEISEEFEKVVLHLLAKKPDDRPEDAEAVRIALAALGG